MRRVLHDYHGHPRLLRDDADAGAQFDAQTAAVMPHGGHGQTITIIAGDTPMIRIDVDVDSAAVRWIPDSTYASDMDTGTPITVYASPYDGLRDVPASLARVTASTESRLLTEYLTTGARPTSVTWHTAV